MSWRRQTRDSSRTALLTEQDVRTIAQGLLKNMNTGLLTAERLQKRAEELMVSAADYWLSYGTAALIYWLADEQEKARQALQRALQADDQKTSLFFFLVLLREKRNQAADIWLTRYLDQQHPLQLASHFQYCLESYTDGWLSSTMRRQMEHMLSVWLQEQSQDAALIEAQMQTWRDWLEKERRAIVPAEEEQFKILKKTPKASIEELLAGAHLPGKVLTSLQKVATDDAPQPEEEAQKALLTRFIASDRSEKEAAFVQQPYLSWLTAWYFNAEKTALSLRQYAMAVAKDWIRSAADDIQGETIQKFPDSIVFYSDLSYEGHTSTLRFQTLDGKNEREELQTLHTIIDAWQKEELKKYRPGWSVFIQLFLLIGGGACIYSGGSWVWENHPYMLLAGVALLCIIMAGPIVGLIITAILAGAATFLIHTIASAYASHSTLFVGAGVLLLAGLAYSTFYSIFQKRRKLETQFCQYAQEEENNICRCMAEAADFYDYYTKGMAQQQELRDFLNRLTPTDYIRYRNNTARRIRV